MISTRGRYALRVIIDLAENNFGDYIPMKEIAERQNISLKYLERILPDLVANNFVVAMKGKGGGYKISKSPDDITVYEILKALNEDVICVECLTNNKNGCERASICKTLSMWKEYNEVIKKFFSSKTIKSLITKDELDYVI